MNIPASIIIEKMEEEMKKLKLAIEDDSEDYREQATVLRAYCEILLSSSKTTGKAAPKVKHATLEDVKGKKSSSVVDEIERLTAYDEDDVQSDSLLDF